MRLSITPARIRSLCERVKHTQDRDILPTDPVDVCLCVWYSAHENTLAGRVEEFGWMIPFFSAQDATTYRSVVWKLDDSGRHSPKSLGEEAAKSRPSSAHQRNGKPKFAKPTIQKRTGHRPDSSNLAILFVKGPVSVQKALDSRPRRVGSGNGRWNGSSISGCGRWLKQVTKNQSQTLERHWATKTLKNVTEKQRRLMPKWLYCPRRVVVMIMMNTGWLPPYWLRQSFCQKQREITTTNKNNNNLVSGIPSLFAGKSSDEQTMNDAFVAPRQIWTRWMENFDRLKASEFHPSPIDSYLF